MPITAGMAPVRLLILVCTVLLAGAARAEPATDMAIRVGNHTGFGRIVFDVPSGTHYTLTRVGDTVTIVFPDTTILHQPPPPPRNVRSLTVSAAQADMVIAAGATLREMRVDGHVVIDVRDAAALPKPPPVPPKPPPEPVREPAPVKAPDPPPAPIAVAEPPTTAPPAPAPSAPAPTASGPIALIPTPTVPPAGVAIAVAFGPKTGAAQFRRGKDVYVVFDERRPIDLAGLQDNPVFRSAVVRELPSGTLLVLHPPAATEVALTRTLRGWKIAVVETTKAPHPIPFTPKDGHLDLPAEASGSVVSMADPDSGATLLIGTMRRAGQAAAIERVTPEFAMMPAELGVVVEPFADTIALRTVPQGFQLTGGPNGLAITQPNQATDAAAAAAHLTRRFRLPAQSVAALTQALIEGRSAEAAAPPQARGPKRRAVARSMLSLGMGAEAMALLHFAAEQDPKEAALPETIGLSAIAALLAGRLKDAAGIDDPRLSGSDEIALWRAIRQAMADEHAPEAAATFAATGALALLYPPGIRDHILPLITETMVLGGQTAAAKRLLALAGDAPGQGFARALLRQADGDAPGALAALNAMAMGHDQRDRARAATRAVELRLASGQLDAAKAADALDKLLYAWRGGPTELALRERIADLHQQAGAWRKALSELRTAQTDFPDSAQSIHTHLMGMFMTLLYSEATDALAPLDLVALVDENADLFKTLPNNEDMQARLADRLMALDLPSRAGPLLEKLMNTATAPVGRATFGARLANLRLNEDDAAGAVAALTASAAPDLDPALAEQRAILVAKAKSKMGDADGAITALSGLTGTAVETARAAVYEQAGNWSAAEEALMQVVGTAIPPAGELNDTQRQLVLRLATAAQRSGDRNGLAALRATLGARLGSGPLADTIRLLTADPVKGTADLPRAERETGLARAIPAAMAAFKPP